MSVWYPSVAPPLSDADLASLLDGALLVLAEIGVECTDETIASRIVASPGISHASGRLRFAPDAVRSHLDARRAASAPEDDRRLSMSGCWAGLNYCDPETLHVRPSTSDEAAQMARLWDARGLSGVVPLQPGDVPPALVTLAAERIALTRSRYLGGALTVTDPEEVRFLRDMNLAAERRYQLREQVAISPLRLNCAGVRTALQFQGDPDLDVGLAGAIPIAGATCPLDPRAALVQATAEALAFDLISLALGFGGGLGLRVEPFDFRYSGIVFGSPEWCLYRATVLRMTEYLTGQTVRGGLFRSTAKAPDEHAACERTATVLWQALLGVRHFGAVGQLAVDEVFSPQQAVIDREILAYVQRVIDGLDLSADPDPVALIREGVATGSFIGTDDTASRFRDLYWFPDLFRHWSVNRWRAEGAPSILSEAWARAKEEIATSTHTLRREQEREIDALYARAQEYLRRRP
jgi:trimethylamine:corrinoid methyltransferase-like protein